MDSIDEQDEYLEELEDQVCRKLGDQLGTLLIEYGYASLDAIMNATDDELLEISGIGEFTLRERIRKPLGQDEPDDSEEPATVDSEVKSASIEAEAAEEEVFAETPSAEQAPTGMYVVRSLFPSRVRIKGDKTPSGATYEWPRAGVEVNVAAEDVEFVMGFNRTTGRACCGGQSGKRRYFELT